MKLEISEKDGLITIKSSIFSYRMNLVDINHYSVVFDGIFSDLVNCCVITLPDGQGGVIIKSKFMGFEERLENLSELKSLEGVVNYILVVNNLLRKGSMKSACLEYKDNQPTQEVDKFSNYD